MVKKLRVRRDSGRRPARTRQHGQSLVEMAILFPLLIFIFIGLVEVGWAIRGYLTLVSTNREATRFAARGDIIDFTDAASAEPGYDMVYQHTYDVLDSNGLGLDRPLEADSNGAVVISHYLIDTGFPCRVDNHGDCEAPVNCEDGWVYDDLVLHPGMPQYEFFTEHRGGEEWQSRLDPFQVADQLVAQNNAFNCTILKKDPTAEMSVNSMILIESFFDQPQLLGLPVVSNAFTDPIPLYAQTAMRISPSKLSQGEGCELFPVTVPRSVIEPMAIDEFSENIRLGGGEGNFGWLKWRTGTSPAEGVNTNSEQYLSSEIDNMRLSMHEYINPNNPDDTVLNVGDRVAGSTGEIAGSDVLDDLYAKKGQTVTLPVWEDNPDLGEPHGSGQNMEYLIVKFVMFTIEEINFQGSNKYISGYYKGEDLSCPKDDLTSNVPNQPPTAEDNSYAVLINDTNFTMDVLTNDSDSDGVLDNSSLTLITDPASIAGTVTVDTGPDPAVLRYDAPASPTTDIFTYRICDEDNACDEAEVTVTVSATNLPPVANDDPGASDPPIVVDKDSSDNEIDALANDSDPEGATLQVSSVPNKTDQNGDIAFDAVLRKFIYSPKGGFYGTDTFTYEVDDGLGGTDTAVVTIIVNAAPEATDDTANTNVATAVTIPVLVNDLEPDTGAAPSPPDHTISLTNPPSAAQGTAAANNGTGEITFTPASGFSGDATFEYKVCDQYGACSAPATVTVTVVSNGPLAWHDFEDGSLSGGDGWSTSWAYNPSDGKTRIESAGGNTYLEFNGENDQMHYAERSVNLASWTNIHLKFDWRTNTQTEPADPLEVWIIDGSGYGERVFDKGTTGQQTSWQSEDINLSSFPSLNLNGTVRVLFGAEMNNNNEWMGFDNIEITGQ